MSEPEITPGGNEPTSKDKAPGSGEAKNTQFDIGYAKGIDKGKKDLLADLGVDNFDALKEALSVKREMEEKTKTTEQRFHELETQHKEATKELSEFRKAAKAEADSLYETLSDEHKKAVDTTGLPKERVIPLMRTLSASKPALRKAGAPVSPEADEPLISIKQSQGLDPEYRTNKRAYIERRMKEVARKHGEAL